VHRLVHISVTNPLPDSPFPYFQEKFILEQTVQKKHNIDWLGQGYASELERHFK
jgi:hypothetical protein